MRRLAYITIILSGLVSFSCHPSRGTNNGAAEVHTADSAERADSIAAADKTATEREAFRRDLEQRLDSMQTRMNFFDSMYLNKKEKGRENWAASRERIKGRMQRLNQRKTEVKTVTKDKWTVFRQNVDTAMQNLKHDWNATLDKMKTNPK